MADACWRRNQGARTRQPTQKLTACAARGHADVISHERCAVSFADPERPISHSGWREQGDRIVAAFTDDIVGYVVAQDGRVDPTSVRIFAADPDNGPSRELGRHKPPTS